MDALDGRVHSGEATLVSDADGDGGRGERGVGTWAEGRRGHRSGGRRQLWRRRRQATREAGAMADAPMRDGNGQWWDVGAEEGTVSQRGQLRERRATAVVCRILAGARGAAGSK